MFVYKVDTEDESRFALEFDQPRKKSFKLIHGVALVAMLGLLALASTLASSIGLTRSGTVEFGQAIVAVGSCDSSMEVLPNSEYSKSVRDFVLSTITFSGVDSSDNGCSGKDFTIMAYGSSSASGLTLFGSSNSIVVSDTGASFTIATNAALSISSSDNTGFTVTINPDYSPILSSSFTKLIVTSSITPVSGAPTISAVSVARGSKSGGTAITITGTGFSAGATVAIGGTAATSVTVVSATSITATTPAHAGGDVDIVVRNTSGLSGTGSNLYHFIYAVGDSADGGGTIYYVTNTAFTSTGSTCNTHCYYLVWAPSGWSGLGSSDPVLPWSLLSTNASGSSIGTGWENTRVIRTPTGAGDATQNAAVAANAYAGSDSTSGGQWFLPSQNEWLAATTSSAAKSSFTQGQFYWTSTDAGSGYAWIYRISGLDEQGQYSADSFRVRPVRAL